MEKKQIMKPVIVNGLKKNSFARDVSISSPICQSKTVAAYVDIDVVKLPTGSYQELVEKDYPINSESVSSYADGADYRRDPLAAISNAPKRVNLGDVSEVQKFLRDNPMEAARQYRDILKKVEIFAKAYETNKGASASSADNGEGDNK